MRIDGGIPGSSSEVFALAIRNVLSVSLDVPFGKSEINQKYFVGGLVESHTEVIWLDVTVDEVPVMHILNS